MEMIVHFFYITLESDRPNLKVSYPEAQISGLSGKK